MILTRLFFSIFKLVLFKKLNRDKFFFKSVLFIFDFCSYFLFFILNLFFIFIILKLIYCIKKYYEFL